MAEEKPFEPTQSHLERARREGNSARSQELANVASFGGALLAAALVATPIARAAGGLVIQAASNRRDVAPTAIVTVLALVPALCAGCASVACAVWQTQGLRFTTVALKFERISPSENLKRMFSRETAITAVRASVAFACASIAIVPAFLAIYAATLNAQGLTAIASAAWSGALQTAATACVIGGVFAAVDYGVQFARWRTRLRMSHEELKRDRKEQDGDALARSRRRSLHRRIARGSLQRVKDAAFVLTNPTHIAIALEYRPPEVAVPRVLVRAADETATRVRELAEQYGVPLVESVALARRLYASTEPGEYIPQETYLAVAEIVAALRRAGSRE